MNQELVDEIAAELASTKRWGAPQYIDAGNSAAVYSVAHPALGDVALKVYDPLFFEGRNALIEANRVALQQVLRGHGNPHLIRVISAEEIPERETWYMLMELCPWKSLDKVIADVPVERIPDLIRQLASAVMYLDEQGLVHRDIKPANIVISDDFSTLKLLDLGVLRRIAAEEGNGTDVGEKRRFIATAQYSPPEYLARDEDAGEAGFQALNLYQVGAVLHDLIMKRPIFHEEASTQNRYQLFRAVTQKSPRLSNADIPPRLLSLCRAALVKDPEKRRSAVKLADFCEVADTTEAIRRRVAARAAESPAVPRPSVLTWETRCREWIRSAARSESASLGPQRLRALHQAEIVRWELTFPRLGRSLEATLHPVSETRLALEFSIRTPNPLHIAVLEISNGGADLDENDIAPHLAANILYLLDLASVPEDGGQEAATE
jgi:serine/threonine protein kinase